MLWNVLGNDDASVPAGAPAGPIPPMQVSDRGTRPRRWSRLILTLSMLAMLDPSGPAVAAGPEDGQEDRLEDVAAHPDGRVLAHPEPAADTAGADYFADIRDIAPLRVRFPDWELPTSYMGHVAVRAGQFMSNAFRHGRYPPPVSTWIAEKVFLAAVLAADTAGRFGGVPGLAPPAPEAEADPEAAYLAAFTAAVAHYGAASDETLAQQAARFREAWLERLATRSGARSAAIERGVRRGERAARRVIATFPRPESERLAITPAAFREEIASELPPPTYQPRQAWRVTPAPAHLERRPFNDYVPVAPGIGLLRPLPRLGSEETSVPAFPAYGSAEWWRALEAVAKYGGVASPCRAPGQTLTGWFFEASASGPPAEAGNAVTAVIAYRDLPVAEAARAQFLAWSAMATAGILTWREKYRHDVLRPVTALNTALPEIADVPGDWRWDSLGPTPPFPAYPSGHAAFTPAAYVALALILAEDVEDPLALRVVVASADPGAWSALTNPDGTSRALEFGALGDVISAANESRAYLGIHWETDGVWGRYLGTLAALRTHQQLLRDPDNPTDPTLAFPGSPPGAWDDPGHDPRRGWKGVSRSWQEQFPASLERTTGRKPARIVAFPGLGDAELPWPNSCAMGTHAD